MTTSKAEYDIVARYSEQFSGAPHWFGIAIGPGWLPIFSQVCEEIQIALDPDELRKFYWIQIKQKWGRLTMYWGPRHPVFVSCVSPSGVVDFVPTETDESINGTLENDVSPASRERVREIIQRAQFQASATCDECASVGHLRSRPSISVLCDACCQSRIAGRAN